MQSNHPFLNFLQTKKITPNQYWILWSQHNSISCPLNTLKGEVGLMVADGILDPDFKPSRKGKEILDGAESFFKKAKIIELDGDFSVEIAAYRSKWPWKGSKASPQSVKEKFIKFFAVYPEFKNKWNLILKATDLYLSEANKDWHYQADHFIVKSIPGEASRYAIYEYLERVSSGEVEVEEGYGMFK